MSFFILCTIYCYLIHHISSEWSFSGIGGPSAQIEYSINIGETTTYIDIVYDGSDRWVGMAFGGLTMTDTYAMIFGTTSEKSNNPTMMDYWLVGHDTGIQKKECSGSTCSQLISYTMSNGKTIINASLDNTAGHVYTYNFDPSGSTPIQLMCAWGKEKLYYEGEHCDGCWGTATFTYSTKSDAEIKILSKTQLGASPISLQMFLRKNDSLKTTITTLSFAEGMALRLLHLILIAILILIVSMMFIYNTTIKSSHIDGELLTLETEMNSNSVHGAELQSNLESMFLHRRSRHSNRYYHSPINNTNKYIFIDGGANRGDTFLALLSGKYRFFNRSISPSIIDIYLFEASPIWNDLLWSLCQKFEQIKGCYNGTAIGTKREIITFYNNEQHHVASSIYGDDLINSPKTKAAVSCIDFCEWMINNKQIHKNDYIVFKLDVEGVEYALLHHIYHNTECIGMLNEMYIEYHQFGHVVYGNNMSWIQTMRYWEHKYREKGITMHRWLN